MVIRSGDKRRTVYREAGGATVTTIMEEVEVMGEVGGARVTTTREKVDVVGEVEEGVVGRRLQLLEYFTKYMEEKEGGVEVEEEGEEAPLVEAWCREEGRVAVQVGATVQVEREDNSRVVLWRSEGRLLLHLVTEGEGETHAVTTSCSPTTLPLVRDTLLPMCRLLASST